MSLNDQLLENKEELSTCEAKGTPEKLLFFLLGNAALLAFNIIINAVDIYAQVMIDIFAMLPERCFSVIVASIPSGISIMK